MSGREGSAARERGLAALLCAAGAGLTLLAAGRPWATVRARDAITPFTGHLTGGDLGWAGALGWAGLAGVAALFAVPGRGRSAVGALLAVFGGLMVYASVTAVGHAHVIAVAGEKSALLRLGARPEVATSLWWLASAAGGVLLAAGGLVVLVRGARWPGMSSRYERAGRARPAASDDPAALWKSLDRGEDPTADDAERPAGRRT